MRQGMNLSYVEIYLTLATSFRRFEFELFNTARERDIDACRDCLLGELKPESAGVRVRVLREIT